MPLRRVSVRFPHRKHGPGYPGSPPPVPPSVIAGALSRLDVADSLTASGVVTTSDTVSAGNLAVTDGDDFLIANGSGGIDYASLPSAPMPTADQFTTIRSNVETYPSGDWQSVRRSGMWLGHNDTWGHDFWGKEFVADGNAVLTSNQYHQRVGIGTQTAQRTISGEIHIKWPATPKPASAPGEVPTAPNISTGQVLGYQGYQLQVTPQVPTKISDIQSLVVGWKSKNTTGTTSKGHLIHHMWISDDPSWHSGYSGTQERITAEFMVIHQHFQNFGGDAGGRPIGSYRGQVTIDGRDWYIFTQAGSAVMQPSGLLCPLIAVVPVNNALPDQIDIAPIYIFCRTTRYDQLPNGAGSHFQLGSNASSFILNPDTYFVQDAVMYEHDGTVGGETHIVLDTMMCFVNEAAPQTSFITGVAGIIDAADTLTSDAVVLITGNLSVTDEPDSLLASEPAGSLDITDEPDTLSATAVVDIFGTLDVTDGVDTLVAANISSYIGTLSVTDDADTLTAAGTVPIVGSMSSIDGIDTLAATAATVQEVLVAGGESPQTGSNTVFTVDLPEAPVGGTQGLTMEVRSGATVTPSGSGWVLLDPNESDSIPNRLKTWTRNGPQSAQTVSVTLGSAALGLGFGWASSGAVYSSASNVGTQSAIASTFSAPASASIANAVTLTMGITGTYPRTASLSAGSAFHNRWIYAIDGGLSLFMAWANTGAGTASIGDWTLVDPDGGSPVEQVRLLTIVFARLTEVTGNLSVSDSVDTLSGSGGVAVSGDLSVVDGDDLLFATSGTVFANDDLIVSISNHVLGPSAPVRF